MDSQALPTNSAAADRAHLAPQATPASTSASRQWVSPGISPRKRLLTGLGVLLASVIFFTIALSEGASMLVSTLIGIVFIGGFVGYLRVIAPTPFTISLDDAGITRQEHGAEPLNIPWEQVAKIKQEMFPNGKPVSIAVFKRVGERGLHRAWVLYGDDVPDFAGLIAAVRAALPEDVPWLAETVHE